MRTTLALAFLFLILFCIMVLVAINCEPRVPTAQAISMAFEWTLHLLGGVVASAAAIGMLLTVAGHGPFQRQIMLTLPLFGGLLLLDAHWGLCLGLAAVACVWMFKFGAADGATDSESAAKSSSIPRA